MRDIVGWLATATRSLAVDVAGRERRRAARKWLRTRLVVLLAVGCGGVVAVVSAAVATVAVGVVLAFGSSPVVVAIAWALVVSLLAVVPLAALRTGAAVHGRLV
jgi:fructose-1,6-bisphosphatase/sedoheptulose 1,7-bisphosphatase-like protein